MLKREGAPSSSIPLALTLPGNSKDDGAYCIGWIMSISSHMEIRIMNTWLDLVTRSLTYCSTHTSLRRGIELGLSVGHALLVEIHARFIGTPILT